MQRPNRLVLFALLLLGAAAAGAVFLAPASATTIYVDDSYAGDTPASHQWTTVQKGLYDAASNDTVYIYNGNYLENVTLGVNWVTVQGESRDGVVIDRQSLGNAVFTVRGHHAVLQNMTLKRGTYAAYIDGASYHNGSMDNITATLINYDCIYIRYAHDWTVHDTEVSSCGYSGFSLQGNPLYNIHMWSLSASTITSYDGITVYYVTGLWASNLTFTTFGRAAMGLQYSSNLHFSNFVINGSGYDGGVHLYSQVSGSSWDNGSVYTTGDWPFYVYDSDYGSVDNVTIEAGSYGGFDFAGYSAFWLWRNVRINTTASPFYLYFPSPIALPDFQHDIDLSNTIRGVPIVYLVNQTGGLYSGPASFLAVVNSTGVNVTVNTTITGLDYGVIIVYTNASTIHDINSSGNGWNFVIERAYNNTFANFSQTFLRSTPYYGGIYLFASSYNLFDGGTWRNMSLYGYAVDVRASSGSHFNTFANISCTGWNTCFYFGQDTQGNRVVDSMITGPYYGVYAYYAGSFEVGRSTITSAYYYSVFAYWYSATPVARTWVHNNTINHTLYYYGVYLYGYQGALIENNSINDSSIGIYGNTLDGLTIEHNNINASRDAGIRGDSSNFWTLTGNTITNSTTEGILFYSSSYWRLRSNRIPDETTPMAINLDASVQVRYANHDVDASNLVNDLPVLWVVNATSGAWNGSYGWIVVDNSSNVSVGSTSPLTRNQMGVLLVGVNDSAVGGVNATANGWGFQAWLSHRNTVADSRFIQNTAGGMYFWGSNWNMVLRATLRPDTNRADYGFELDGTAHNNTFESGDCASFNTCMFANYNSADMRVLNSTFNDSYYAVYSYSPFGPFVSGNAMNFSYYYHVYIGYFSTPGTRGYRVSNNTMNRTYSQTVYCSYCQGGLIEDNVMRGDNIGVYFYYGQGGIVARNDISAMASAGIYGYYSDFHVLIDNIIRDGTAASSGVNFASSRFWLLRGNNVTNQTRPVAWSFTVPMSTLEYAMHDADPTNLANGYPWRWWVNASGVSFNGTAGLVILTNSTAMNVTVSNQVARAAAAVSLVGTNGSTIYESNLSQNEWAFVLYHSHNNSFRDLTVSRNTAGGAYFAYSDWNRIEGGRFTPDTTYADPGVQFTSYARNNTVSSNISGFYYDIYMDTGTAFDNGVDGGTYANAYYGIYSNAQGGTRAEHANFTDNYYQHLYFYGGPASARFARISNNTFHRASGYDSLFIYYMNGGLIADNLINGTSREAIYLYYSTGITALRNTITNDSDYAFNGYYSSYNTLADNVITTSRYGIYLQESRYWTFNNNSIFNLTGSSPWAVNTYSVDPVVDETLFMHTWTPDNTINGGPVRYYVNASGVTFSGPAGWIVAVNSSFMDLASTTPMSQDYISVLFVKVFNSTVRNTVTNGSYYGAVLSWGADNRVLNLSANASNTGIYLSNNTRVTIDRVVISNASQRGVYAYQSTRLNITNSTFYRNYYGNYLEYRSQFVNITNNLFDSQGYISVYTEATDDVRITGNTILASAYYGILLQGNAGDQANRDFVSGNRLNASGYYDSIYLYYTYSSTVEFNNVTNSSSAAVDLYSSNANTVRGNTFRFNYYGFYLNSADSNTFLENTVSNTSYTIYLTSSADFNLLYHNNFFTNNNSMYDIGTSNLFHNGYPSGGNFWSNTTHTDLYKGSAQATSGPDGINDTSLILPYARVDSYPLTEPWPPYVTLVSPANGSVIRAGVTIDLNISFYFDTVQYALNNDTTSNLTTPFDISTGGLPDGDLFVQVWGNDSTGFTQRPWFVFVIDSTSPAISSDSPTAGGTYPVGTQLNFTVSDAHLAANVTRNNGSGAVPLTTPWDIDTAGWLEGDYNITIIAWDTAGNTRSSTFLYKLDSTAPSVSLVSPANGSFIAVGTLIDLAVSDAHLSGVTWNNGTGPNTLVAPFDISTAGWGSATYNMTVIASDTGGLSTTRVYTFTIDASPPVIALNSPLNNSVFEPGVTIDLDVSDANLVGVTWNTGSGPTTLSSPYDISTTGWADGAYNLTVSANDTAGNIALRVFHFEVDSLAPAVGVTSPANNSWISVGTPLDFSVADAHLASVTWTIGSGDNALSSPFDISTAGWADGTWAVRVNATDSLGHFSSANLTVRIDSVLPTITLVSPSNGSYFAAGATIDLAVSDTNLNLVNWTTGGAPSALASPFDISTTGWADGVYSLRLNATDLAGNLRFASFTFTVDSTAPTLTLVSPASGAVVRAGTTIDLSVTDTNLNSANWTTGGAPSALASPFDIDTTGWADGAYTVRVNATDLAGNLRSSNFTFTLDSTPPTVALNSPSNGSVFRAGTTIDLAVSDTNLNFVNWTTGAAPTALASPFDISTTGWADGTYTLRVNATDLAGNLRYSSYTFALDSTPPTIVLNSPSPGAIVVAGTTIDLSVSDANLSIVTWNNGTATTLLALPFDISTTGWADGAYSISVFANDTAGNAAWLNFTITVDSTPPSIALVSPANGSVIRAGTVLVWTIADPNLLNASYNNGTADVPFGAPFQLSTAGYIDRNYNFTLFARDAAGNLHSARFNFTIDSTAPQILLLSPANNTTVAEGVTIDFAVSDLHLSLLTVRLDGSPVALDPGFDYASNNLTDGTHTFAIVAGDEAGNTRSLNATFLVDKTAPRVNFSPASGSYLPAGTAVSVGIVEANLALAQWRNETDIVWRNLSASHIIDTTGWPDGLAPLVVQVADNASHLVVARSNITIDSTAPSIEGFLAQVQPGYWQPGRPIGISVANETSPYTIEVYVRGNLVGLTALSAYDYTLDVSSQAEGQADIDIRVTDQAGNSAQVTVVLKFDGTAPALASPLPMAYGGNEDSPFAFHATAIDAIALPAELSYLWRFNDSRLLSEAILPGSDANWTFTTPGNYAIEVSVTDPAGNFANTTINVTIFDITPPSLTLPVTWINTTEDTPVAITQTSLDNGNGTLNWTWRAPSANLTSFGPNITWVFQTPGLYNISVTVSDPQNNSARGYVMVNVSDITAPTISIVGPSVVDVLIPALFSANASDNDPRYTPANWSFTWTYINTTDQVIHTGTSTAFQDSRAETVTIRLTVVDASGNSKSVEVPLLVNAPPSVDSSPPTEVSSNGSWVWQVNATDPEGHATNITLVDPPPGMTVNPDGTITWTPPPGSGGTNQNVTVAISDGLSTVYRNFTLYVIDPALLAGNHVPVFDSEPPTDASVNKLYAYTVQVHDDDSDPIVLTITGLDGARFNPSTGLLTWMPPWQPDVNERFERIVPVVITAFDGKQTSKQEFSVRFRNPPNIWPVLTGLFGIGDVHNGDVLRIYVQGNWSDADDFIANLTFVVNETNSVVRGEAASVIRWHTEVVDLFHSILVIEVIADHETTVRFNMSARDPSGGKSDSSYVTVHVMGSVLQPAGQASFPWWMLLILAVGGAAGAAGLVVSLRRSRSATQVAQSALETAAKAPTERVIIQQAPGAAAPEARRDTYVIEGVFIIYGDGRLVYSKTDISEVKFEDPELVASMFSAVQSFIKDSFQQEGELNRLGMGENAIMIERGTSIYMAAIIYGEPQADLTDAMRETIRTIENAYAGIIEDWDGSTTSLEAIDQYVEPFLALTSTRTRADAKQAMTEKVVKMPSELEFFQGFVRLKCGVKNDTDTVITKVTVSIDYNEDVLRLHHIEPDSYKYQGSEVQLGVLNPGEKVSVAYYFDPQICTESQIDGVGRYRDAKGGVHSIAMKTRKAEVVCPIFFTKEHANTAMLKRLVEGELNDMDSKIFNITTIPEGMKWSEIFGLVKEVVLGHDVHLVRDFIVAEPYHGEAWFYGETKVKGYKIVIRASVIEENRKIEFFAASTQIRAITGLLAEFNHTLQSLIGRKYATLKVEPEFSEEIKQDIQKKSLMGKLKEGELEGGETEQQN